MNDLFTDTLSQLNMLTIRKSLMFNDRQLELIADAVEDYAAQNESDDNIDECGEILDIIDAYFHNKNFRKIPN